MKTLQNNFTTPEQSKKLLKLGVPADSADCYYTQEEIEGNMYWFDLHIKREYQPHTSLHASTIYSERLPAWSVGRLIEIHTICGGASSSYYISAFPTNILNEVMWHLTEAVRHGWIDFSKLEE